MNLGQAIAGNGGGGSPVNCVGSYQYTPFYSQSYFTEPPWKYKIRKVHNGFVISAPAGEFVFSDIMQACLWLQGTELEK